MDCSCSLVGPSTTLDHAGELSRRQETAAVAAADADDHQSSDEDEEDDVSYLLKGDSQKYIGKQRS